MKLLRIRGVHRIVGNCHADPARSLALHSGPYLHELVRDAQTGAPPAPPPTLDRWTAAAAALATILCNGPGDPDNPPGFPDGVGDCILASDLHEDAGRAAVAGAGYVPRGADALALYARLAGFHGTADTDNGTDPADLIAWRLAGNQYPNGSVALAAPPVDPTSPTCLAQALWLAGPLKCWAALPAAVEGEEDAGDTWDDCGPPVPENGHGFTIVDYDLPSKRFRADTWGIPVWLTAAFCRRYLVRSAGGGCVAMLDRDILDRVTGLAPAGFDFETLRQYLGAVQAAASASPGSPSSEVDRIRAALVDFARTLGHDEERIARWLGHFFQSTEGL